MTKFLALEKNLNWKGENACYDSKHRWIARHYGRPQKCEDCGRVGVPENRKRFFDWANISHSYKRERSDWKRLCRKCHRKMDTHLQVRGEKIHKAKLKELDIILIRELINNSKLTYKRIGSLFKVTPMTIWDIKSYRTWKHIK